MTYNYEDICEKLFRKFSEHTVDSSDRGFMKLGNDNMSTLRVYANYI